VHRQELSGDRPGRGWELELNTFKTYPCGVVAHPAMDAAIAASDRIDPAEITTVALRCHPLVPELMGTVQPGDGLRSRFSARHGVAVGLLFGRAGLAEFSDAVATAPEVAGLRALITLDPDPGVARDAAVLRIETRSADPVEVRVEHTRGSVARPLTDAELLAKVRLLADPVLGDGGADRIRAAVDGLPAAADVSGLFAALRPGHNGATSGAPGLGVFTASHRRPNTAPNDAASHPRRPAPTASPEGPAASHHGRPAGTPAPGSMTERILALARYAAPTLEAEADLARFTAAVATARGISAARGLQRALRPGHVSDPPPPHAPGRLAGSALPGGPAWTAWVTGTAAVAARAAEIPPDNSTGADPVVTMVVCAAGRALGDDCAAAVAAGVQAAELVGAGLASGGGWSIPVVSAAIGAGLAAGLMLRLPESQLRNALGICATQAAGLRAADGTDAGPLQAGKAAFNAVEAALLARAGFTGPAEPLDGRRGLFALFRPPSG
jgi:2-methylcitrate dehydratase PrpD